jgi:hypothetical protein
MSFQGIEGTIVIMDNALMPKCICFRLFPNKSHS